MPILLALLAVSRERLACLRSTSADEVDNATKQPNEPSHASTWRWVPARSFEQLFLSHHCAVDTARTTVKPI
ncbi:unnamed protein product [Strongylus vulgaris]|uniref:Uncharacterized protein n=1 Tax=Strongylus vulgaris TaxID=40348 RepID=A0A3P7J031_STRVU|nr:unnamed protein product [Strongylus vulgaris]